MRTEEVRTKLLPGEWGPWEHGTGLCVGGMPGSFNGIASTMHPVEEPYFFHCHKCLAVARSTELRQPHPKRDCGLCEAPGCGKPAALHKEKVLLNTVAARQAEAQNVTIARIITSRWCATCDPYARPYCRAVKCPKRGKPHRVEAGFVCASKSHGVHCRAACKRVRVADAARRVDPSRPACVEEGCEKRCTSKGMCSTHYTKWLANDPSRPACVEESCEKRATHKGMCQRHYREGQAIARPLLVRLGRPTARRPA